MKSIILNSTAFLGALALSLSGAQAIELVRALPLPDDGHGSQARGVISSRTFSSGGDSGSLIVTSGVKIDEHGRRLPVVWEYNTLSGEVTSSTLSVPAGAEGEAIGGAEFASRDQATVGNITAGGVTRSVIWRKPAGGIWGAPAPLGPAALVPAVLTSVDIPRIGQEVIVDFIATGSVTAGGLERPLLYRISLTSVEPALLPLPPGAQGAATDYSWDAAGNRAAACGWAASLGRLRKPVLWRSGDADWSVHSLPVPDNSSGRALGVTESSGPGSNRVVAPGEIMSPAGRTMAAKWELSELDAAKNELDLVSLPPCNGYQNSSATAQVALGGPDTTERVVFGTSWNPGGDTVATMWFVRNDPGSIGEYRGTPVRFLLDDPGAVVEVAAVTPGTLDQIAVGQIIATSGTPPRAALFLSTNSSVPDFLMITAGFTGTELIKWREQWLRSLWHNDGNELRIRTRSVHGTQRADLELAWTPMYTVDHPVFSKAEADLVFRFDAPDPDVTSGSIGFIAYNFAAMQEVLIDTRPLSRTAEIISVTFPGPATGWMDPRTGRARMRIEFTPGRNRSSELVIDLAQLRLE